MEDGWRDGGRDGGGKRRIRGKKGRCAVHLLMQRSTSSTSQARGLEWGREDGGGVIGKGGRNLSEGVAVRGMRSSSSEQCQHNNMVTMTTLTCKRMVQCSP